MAAAYQNTHIQLSLQALIRKQPPINKKLFYITYSTYFLAGLNKELLVIKEDLVSIYQSKLHIDFLRIQDRHSGLSV